MSSSSSSILLGMGNPLLDISCVITKEDDDILEKYELKMNNAILAEDKHQPMFKEMVEKYDVEYIAGGATQNSIRVCQWMFNKQKELQTTFIGCIGPCEFGKQMKEACEGDGVQTNYMIDEQTPTGTCAVLVKEGERSLIAALNAANNYKFEHLQRAENWKIVEDAKFYYSAGFFLTVSPESIMAVAKHSADEKKCYTMNLSAPFLMQVPPFLEAMMNAMPYVDVLFGNESEALTFAESQKWEGVTDVAEIALKITQMPKASAHCTRTVVFTQGADATIVAKDGKVTKYDVIKLAKEDLVDTNGAGDAFVGGFLSQYVQGKEIADCCKGGNYAANAIIQQSGCKCPGESNFSL